MVKAQALFSRKWVNEAPPRYLGQRYSAPPFQLGLAGATAITDANFAQILSAPKAVADFWVPTCPPCVAYKPVFENVAMSTPDVLMATVNINDAPVSAGQANIAATPTTIFYVNGKEVDRVEGGMSDPGLRAEMAKAFGGMPGGAISTSEGPGLTTLLLGGVALAGLAAGAFYLFGKKRK